MQRFMVDGDPSSADVSVAGAGAQPWAVGSIVRLQGSTHHHLVHVMRAQVGDEVEVVCEGRAFAGKIDRLLPDAVLVRCVEELQSSESPLRLTWLQGLPKGDKIDAVLRQACEIGAAAVHVFAARRSVAALTPERAQERVSRWRRIVQEEAAVAKRTQPPQVHYFASLEGAVRQLPVALPLLVPYELQDSRLPHLRDILAPQSEFTRQLLDSGGAVMAIGPEGGFDDEEIAQLRARGAHLCTLGPRILRTEYAGMAVAAILLYVGEQGLQLPWQEVQS